MSDIAVRFADAPIHRVGFEIAGGDVETLAKTYPDRIFRARRKSVDGNLVWVTLILRFGEQLFLQAIGDERNWAEVFAVSEEQAMALQRQILALL